MEKLNKELILNVSLVSLLLTVILAAVGAEANVKMSDISYGWFIPFMFYALILYIFNLFVSFLNYWIGRAVRRLPARLIVFNLAGVMLLATAWYLMKEAAVLAAFSSFIAISVIAAVVHRAKAGS